MSETETVIMCTHDGQPEHLWRPGDGCPDAIPAGTWSVRPASLADTSDPRFTDDQRATLARFEAAPTPPEIVEARVVEEVARAMRATRECQAGMAFGVPPDARDQFLTALAAAAVAAYRARDGGAEEAVIDCGEVMCIEAAKVRRVEALATVWEGVANTWQETADHPNTGPEFRAHCLAERDDFRDRVTVLRAVVATRADR